MLAPLYGGNTALKLNNPNINLYFQKNIINMGRASKKLLLIFCYKNFILTISNFLRKVKLRQ